MKRSQKNMVHLKKGDNIAQKFKEKKIAMPQTLKKAIMVHLKIGNNIAQK